MKIAKCLAVLAVVALSGQAALADNPHNLSDKAWTGGQICLPCHTPHRSDKEVGYLWNHAIPEDSDFTKVDPNAELSPAYSLTCLGCHDGQTAIDAIGGDSGTTAMTGVNVIGRDLTNDHPVGVPYGGHGMAAKGTTWGGRQPAAGGMPIFGDDETIQCATCHTPHSNAKGNFLRKTMDGSELCIACHEGKAEDFGVAGDDDDDG